MKIHQNQVPRAIQKTIAFGIAFENHRAAKDGPKTPQDGTQKGFKIVWKRTSDMNKNLIVFLKLFWSRRGAVLGGQNPPDSIIPEFRFSSLFPTSLRGAFRRRPRRDFGLFWEVLASILDALWFQFFKVFVQLDVLDKLYQTVFWWSKAIVG